MARISGRKVSGLSKHNRDTNHVELKGPDKDDPVIRFNINYRPHIQMALLDSGKIVPCTLFLPDFRLVFETGSMMKLTGVARCTMQKFPRYTVPEKTGRHRHGRCSHPLVASASG